MKSLSGIIVDNNRQTVLLIKELIARGYKDKHICMVTQSKQPYLSKVRHGKIHANTKLHEGEEIIMTPAQERRLETLEKIINLPEIITPGIGEQDVIYIHVLKFFMVSKKDIYNLYFHITKSHFNRLWVAKNIDIRDFDPSMINITLYEYLDLIIDFFIDNLD